MISNYTLGFLVAFSGLTAIPTLAEPACPPQTKVGKHDAVVYSEGEFVISTGLNVNPDGNRAAYTPGDHGYTYIVNGLDMINPTLDCRSNFEKCTADFKKAEHKNFGPGTQTFCVFALEVEPIPPSKTRKSCGGGRFYIGNGLGQPMMGHELLDTIKGPKTPYYVSMSNLRQMVDGKASYIDSALVPSLVAPSSKSSMLGQVVYVSYGANHTLAVIGDTGPDFSEGSIALHQLLHFNQLRPLPPVGPIPASLRCNDKQMPLDAPFTYKPDGGKANECVPGKPATADADIRAYNNIAGGVKVLFLKGAKLPVKGSLSTVPVTVQAMQEVVDKAGYTQERLEQMTACLKSD